MNPNNIYPEVKRFGLIFMPINWLVCLIVTLILRFCVKDQSFWSGYLLGSVCSFLTFGLHMKSVGYPEDKKTSGFKKALTSYFVRFLFSGVILFLAFYSTYMVEEGNILYKAFNLYATFIGLVVIKFLLIIFALVLEIYKKHKNKDVKPNDTIKDSLTVEEMALRLENYESEEKGGMEKEND